MSYPKLWLPHLYTMETNKWVQRCVGKSVWCKKILGFWWKHFPPINFVDLHLFSSNRWADK